MPRMLLLCLLLAAPLAAEQAAYESNFGRVILSRSDLIVQGVASATRTKVGGSYRVELTIEETLYGDKHKEVSFLYTERKLLPEEATRALFALKKVTDGVYNLVGKPVLTPAGDGEERDKLKVAREFIDLEDKPEGDERTEDFYALLVKHIKLGGYAAQNAAVELMFVARDRGRTITEKRFDTLVATRNEARARLTTQAREDLELAFQGMVEARVKGIKFRHVRRGETRGDKRQGADDLLALQSDYPRAFDEDDARLADALQGVGDDVILKDKLKQLAKEIRDDLRRREAEKRRKEQEARDRIRHAEGD